jgi:hypothetical protein
LRSGIGVPPEPIVAKLDPGSAFDAFRDAVAEVNVAEQGEVLAVVLKMPGAVLNRGCENLRMSG